jgi:hypothetical protein
VAERVDDHVVGGHLGGVPTHRKCTSPNAAISA